MRQNTGQSKSAAIRAKLSHPIIDSDGHTAEFEPALFDYFRDIGGIRDERNHHADGGDSGPGHSGSRWN